MDMQQIFEVYFSGDPKERENAMKEYGWDPVPLFE